MQRILVAIFTLTILYSCKKQEVGPQCPTCEEEIIPTTSDVLIGCEGNFGWGNASITQYDPNNKLVAQQLFQNVNGFALGDVLQSFYQVDEKLYIILNNSGKIEIIDTADYSSVGSITGFNSPRYMVSKNGIGYISDLYNNGVTVLDLNSNQIIDTVVTNCWTEHLLLDNDRLYIACPDTNWVLNYHIPTGIFLDTIIVGKSPSGMVQVSDGHLWFLSSGGYQEEIPNLVEYDGQTIVQTIPFGSIADSPLQLKYDLRKERLIFLNQDLYTFDLTTNTMISTPSFVSSSSIFYGLGIDPHNSDIYISDAVDYVQHGKVIRIDSLYNPIDTFSTGIIPQTFWFK